MTITSAKIRKPCLEMPDSVESLAAVSAELTIWEIITLLRIKIRN